MRKSFEEEQLPEKVNLGVWIRIGKYAIESWPLLLVLAFTMLLTTFYDSSFVPVMNAGAIAAANAFEGSILPASIWEVTIPVTFIFGIKADLSFGVFTGLQVGMIIIRSLAIYWTFYLTNIIGMRIMTSLRRDSFKKIQLLSFSYFDKISSGWLVARMNNDTSNLGDVLSWGVIMIVWSLGDLFFTVITMFTANWLYSLLIFASIPLLVIILPIFQKKQLKLHRISRNAYSHFVGWLAESIDGSKTIKTLGIEDEVANEADEITEDIRIKRYHSMRIDAFFQPFVSLLGSIVICVIMVYGLVYDKRDVSTRLATMVLFISFARNIFNPLQSLSETFSDFIATQAGAEKVMQILDSVPEIQDRPDVIAKYGDILGEKKDTYPRIKGKIEFKDVSFAYSNGVEVIHPLNLTIKKGTSLAIVGETGSGKTTTVNLLCRFYQPTKGQILIDDSDYLNMSLGCLRTSIGYVQQNPFVFSSTYFENIAYGKLDATLEEVRTAAKLVGIDDFIMSQPQGYHTHLEDGGGTLSQGQKQLISFARALIRDPAILILDEATSSIDTETEAQVQKAIETLLKGRTSIVIAHRLSTIVGSDRILVMESGSIKEDGNHSELMKQKGAYFQLYMNQFKNLAVESQVEAYTSQIEAKGIKIS